MVAGPILPSIVQKDETGHFFTSEKSFGIPTEWSTMFRKTLIFFNTTRLLPVTKNVSQISVAFKRNVFVTPGTFIKLRWCIRSFGTVLGLNICCNSDLSSRDGCELQQYRDPLASSTQRAVALQFLLSGGSCSSKNGLLYARYLVLPV